MDFTYHAYCIALTLSRLLVVLRCTYQLFIPFLCYLITHVIH